MSFLFSFDRAAFTSQTFNENQQSSTDQQHNTYPNAHLHKPRKTNSTTPRKQQHLSPTKAKQWPGTPQTIAPSAVGTSPSTHGTTTPTPVIGAPSPAPAPAPAPTELGVRTRVTAVSMIVSAMSTSTKLPSGARGVEAVMGLLRTTTTFPGDIIIARRLLLLPRR